MLVQALGSKHVLYSNLHDGRTNQRQLGQQMQQSNKWRSTPIRYGSF